MPSEEWARGFVAERCDSAAMLRLERLADLLVAETARQNLVAAATLPHLWSRHIADSAQLLDYVDATPAGPWLDLGTGAGFPGLVIAAMRPAWDVVLVESRRLRTEWLTACVEALGLSRCRALGARVERIPPLTSGVISARAFAPLPRLVELAVRFSTSDTLWLLPKGRSAAQEVGEMPKHLRSMFHVEPSVTDADSGIVVGRGIEVKGA